MLVGSTLNEEESNDGNGELSCIVITHSYSKQKLGIAFASETEFISSKDYEIPEDAVPVLPSTRNYMSAIAFE